MINLQAIFVMMKTYEKPQEGMTDKTAFSTLTEREQILDSKIIFHKERFNVWDRSLKPRKPRKPREDDKSLQTSVP